MPAAHKVLGQVSPAVAATDTTLYTVPASGSAIVSTITVCNIAAANQQTFRIRIAVAGAASANKQWLAYDTQLGIGQTVTLTLGLTLAAGDQIVVQSLNANFVAFQAFGQEYTP